MTHTQMSQWLFVMLLRCTKYLYVLVILPSKVKSVHVSSFVNLRELQASALYHIKSIKLPRYVASTSIINVRLLTHVNLSHQNTLPKI